MSDDTTREQKPEFIEAPTGAQMLQTLGQATKTPGRCACGEHADPEAAEDHTHDA